MGSSDEHKGCHANIESGTLDRFQNKGHIQKRDAQCTEAVLVLFSFLFCCQINIEKGTLDRFQNKGHIQNIMLNFVLFCFVAV